MKKIILFVLTVVLSLVCSKAQNVDELLKKYEGKQGVERVRICPKLMKGMSKIIAGLAEFSVDMTEKDKEGVKLLESIEEIQILTTHRDTVDFYKEFSSNRSLKHAKYELLMETSATDKDTYIYSLDSKKDVFSDLLVFITNKNDKGVFLASVKGKIDPDNIIKIIEFAHKESKKSKRNCQK